MQSMRMRPLVPDVAWSVCVCVCLFACLFVATTSPRKKVEPICVPFGRGRLTHIGPRKEPLLKGVVTLAPTGDCGGLVCVAAMRAVTTSSVATCVEWYLRINCHVALTLADSTAAS